jgi:hypothetical protein
MFHVKQSVPNGSSVEVATKERNSKTGEWWWFIVLAKTHPPPLPPDSPDGNCAEEGRGTLDAHDGSSRKAMFHVKHRSPTYGIASKFIGSC